MAVYQGMEVDKVIDEVADEMANEVAGGPGSGSGVGGPGVRAGSGVRAGVLDVGAQQSPRLLVLDNITNLSK